MKKTLFLALLLSLCLALPARAQDPTEEISLYVGQVKILPVDHPIRIVIGKPEVADINLVTEKELTVNAKAAGVTTLVFWDTYGEQDYRVKVFSENMSETKDRADTLIKELNLPGVYTKTADSESKILIMGEVKTAQDRERVFSALSGMKEKLIDMIKVKEEEKIVDIDVQVLELDKDATKTLGFSFPGSLTITDLSPATTDATLLKDIFRITTAARSEFTTTLDALVQEGKARVLSRPRVACQSGKEAELLVGGEKPVLSSSISTTGVSTSVSYKEFGIKLKIKPLVIGEKRIKLGLNVEVSDVLDAVILGPTNAPTALAYPLTKRNVSTELALNDGQTMAIGGLRKQKQEEDIRKTPFVGDMPIVGMFFRQKKTRIGGGQGQRGDTELFVTLTPTIIAPAKEEPVKELKPEVPQAVSVPVAVQELDPLQNYAQIIQGRIMENLTYPASAKEAGFHGTVKLKLHLSYMGQLIDAAVAESSGYKVLDDNAVSVSKSISSYPPFPPAIIQKEIWIEIPILYSLE